MTRKAFGLNMDRGWGCLMIVVALIMIYIDVDIMDLINNENNEVIRLISRIENPKTTVYIKESNHQLSRTSEHDLQKCTHFNCFDIYRCGVQHQKLLVHVPDPKEFLDSEGNVVAPLTQDFVTILEAIAGSEYYTEDPEEACVFIPALDLLNQTNQKLNPNLIRNALAQSSSHWNDGKNHLIFSVFPSNKLTNTLGKAMQAASGLSSLDYRPGFDISLPAYSLLQEQVPIKKSSRQFLVVMPQTLIVKPHLRNIIQELEKSGAKDVKTLEPCMVNHNHRCDMDGQVHNYPDILSDSTFCLILDTEYDAGQTITEALHFGCIPVILLDSVVLPFSEVIDWKRFSIRMYETDLSTIYDTLSKISPQRIEEMQRQITFIYTSYFSSWRAIVNTTLAILNDRIVPHHTKNYKHWNLPPSVHESSPLFLRNLPPASDGFTAVILTYDRVDSLFNVIKRIAETPSLTKVLVIWNNQEKAPPPVSSWPTLAPPKSLKVIKTHANLLSNRFYPYDEITTEAVLSLDDDINMLTSDELEFGYQVWREFPDRLVGFPSRTHVWEDSTQKMRYESEWTSQISMVLTGASFYHKYWHYLFTGAPSKQAQDIKRWVDEHMNCEDIAMNFLIANATRKAPIKVAPRKKFKCSTPQCENQDMQLSGDQTHMVTRSECINLFAEKYEYVPLKEVEFRVDPVLYKDDVPEKLKKYSNLGSL